MNAIELKNVDLKFGERQILENISFKVQKGQIHGFLGPNGAGKTTTMKCIVHLLTHFDGSIYINDQDIKEQKLNLHNELGFLLEDPPLYNDMKVKEYLAFIAKLKKVPSHKISQRVDYCKEVLDLSEVFERPIEHLSKGFKQRVGIAQAIIHDPSIVILDEPTIGLDPYSVIEIRNLILKLKKDHTILLSSHLLHEMSLVCDEVTIISNGRILESGSIEDIEKRFLKDSKTHLKTLKTTPEWESYLKSKSINCEKSLKDDVYYFTLHTSLDFKACAEIVKKTVEFNIDLIAIDQKHNTLEDIFIKVVDK